MSPDSKDSNLQEDSSKSSTQYISNLDEIRSLGVTLTPYYEIKESEHEHNHPPIRMRHFTSGKRGFDPIMPDSKDINEQDDNEEPAATPSSNDTSGKSGFDPIREDSNDTCMVGDLRNMAVDFGDASEPSSDGLPAKIVTLMCHFTSGKSGYDKLKKLSKRESLLSEVKYVFTGPKKSS